MQSDLFVRWDESALATGHAVRLHHWAVQVFSAHEIRTLDTDEVVDVVFSSERADVERALVRADSKSNSKAG